MKKNNQNFEDYDLYEERVILYDDDDAVEDEEEYIDDEESEEEKKTRKLLNTNGGLKLTPALIALLALAIFLAVVVFIGGTSMQSRIKALTASNTEMMNQMVNIRQNVYVASQDIAMGDKIVYSGAATNVELTQVYTSVDSTLYVSASDEGLAQVDIKAGTPITMQMVGSVNPLERMAPERIIEEVPVEEQIVIPYQITADFIDLKTGERIAPSVDLQLDPGINEKAFNMKEATMDGWILRSIKIEGNSVHSFGAIKKNLKAGTVWLYYYTNKRGWARVEIKGNIRVEYAYIKDDSRDVGQAGGVSEDIDADLAAQGVSASAPGAEAEEAEDADEENADAAAAEQEANSTAAEADSAPAAPQGAAANSETVVDTNAAGTVNAQEEKTALEPVSEEEAQAQVVSIFADGDTQDAAGADNGTAGTAAEAGENTAAANTEENTNENLGNGTDLASASEGSDVAGSGEAVDDDLLSFTFDDLQESIGD